MRDKIKEKLIEIDQQLFYGMVPEGKKINEWNYIVFNQNKIKKGGTANTDYTFYYSVIIAREDYIPDDLLFEVIEKMLEIPGLRLADNEFKYDYITKTNTDMVVELLKLDFVRCFKGCNAINKK